MALRNRSRKVLALAVAPQQRGDDGRQLASSGHGLARARCHQRSRQSASLLELAVEAEDVCQLIGSVAVHHVGSAAPRTLVHAHVQGGILAVAEASRRIVEVVARHAEVGQQAVDGVDAVVAHPVVEVAEVAAHELPAPVAAPAPRDGILVLVEAEQPSLATEAAQNLTTMAAAAECSIHVNAISLDV